MNRARQIQQEIEDRDRNALIKSIEKEQLASESLNYGDEEEPKKGLISRIFGKK